MKLLDSGIGFFCFDTLCQLAYMIYITNAKARTNILSITSGCRVYLLFTIHMGVLQRSQDRLVGWEEGGIQAVDSQENH